MDLFLEHPLAFFVLLFVLLALAVECGFRLASRTGAAADEIRREQIATSRDSLGILLSFLLGFTLAMALPHYDSRKQLVMEEANSIATTALRSGLLPDAQRSQLHPLLAEYIQARLAYSRAALDTPQFAAALDRSKSLQSALWLQAQEAARQNPGPITALFISSLNDTIDLAEKRLTALESRIPVSIWFMLIFIALLTAFTSGYGQRRRFWLISLVSPLAIAVVMGLIADLDSPRSGFLRADLRSLERLAADATSRQFDKTQP